MKMYPDEHANATEEVDVTEEFVEVFSGKYIAVSLTSYREVRETDWLLAVMRILMVVGLFR